MPDFDPSVFDVDPLAPDAKARMAALVQLLGQQQQGNVMGAMGGTLRTGMQHLGQGMEQQAQQQMGMLQGAPAARLALAMDRLKQQRESQEIQQAGPQEELSGQTPSVFSMLTKRAEIRKPIVVPPGSGLADWNGKPLAGGMGGNDIIKQTADGIEQGLAPPDMKGLGRLRVPVQAELSKRGYNLSQANLDWQATQKHLATLNSGGQERLNQAINFVSDTIPVIRQLYAEVQQLAPVSGFKMLNRATLSAMKQLPGKAGAAAQALDTQVNDFASELGTVYKGGGTSTDKSLGMAASNLSSDWNPETFNKALDLAERNIAIRKNSVSHSTVRGASAGNVYAQPPGTAPAAAPPAAAPDAAAAAAARRAKYGL